MGTLMIFAVGIVVGAMGVVIMALSLNTRGWTEEYIRELGDYKQRTTLEPASYDNPSTLS